MALRLDLRGQLGFGKFTKDSLLRRWMFYAKKKNGSCNVITVTERYKIFRERVSGKHLGK